MADESNDRRSDESPNATDSGSGSAGTVEAMIEAHADALFGYAVLRVGDRYAAEDLVQETFVAAMGGRDGFRGDSSERTWLIGILRHKILDHLRRSGRERPASAEAEGEGDDDPAIEGLFDERGMWKKHPAPWRPDPHALMEDEEFWAVFERCRQGLPERQGRAFALRVVDQLESAEVCDALGIRSNNLWVMLHRARTRLRECLENRWFASGHKTSEEA